jgi:hypothetical protein
VNLLLYGEGVPTPVELERDSKVIGRDLESDLKGSRKETQLVGFQSALRRKALKL